MPDTLQVCPAPERLRNQNGSKNTNDSIVSGQSGEINFSGSSPTFKAPRKNGRPEKGSLSPKSFSRGFQETTSVHDLFKRFAHASNSKAIITNKVADFVEALGRPPGVALKVAAMARHHQNLTIKEMRKNGTVDGSDVLLHLIVPYQSVLGCLKEAEKLYALEQAKPTTDIMAKDLAAGLTPLQHGAAPAEIVMDRYSTPASRVIGVSHILGRKYPSEPGRRYPPKPPPRKRPNYPNPDDICDLGFLKSLSVGSLQPTLTPSSSLSLSQQLRPSLSGNLSSLKTEPDEQIVDVSELMKLEKMWEGETVKASASDSRHPGQRPRQGTPPDRGLKSSEGAASPSLKLKDLLAANPDGAVAKKTEDEDCDNGSDTSGNLQGGGTADGGRGTDGAQGKKRDPNPFVEFEDREQRLQWERRWLQDDVDYMGMRTRELEQGTRHMNLVAEHKDPEDAYCEAVYHGAYSVQVKGQIAVKNEVYRIRRDANKAKEEAEEAKRKHEKAKKRGNSPKSPKDDGVDPDFATEGGSPDFNETRKLVCATATMQSMKKKTELSSTQNLGETLSKTKSGKPQAIGSVKCLQDLGRDLRMSQEWKNPTVAVVAPKAVEVKSYQSLGLGFKGDKG